MDMTATVAPKSDQLNADDLIAGPRTIKITAIKGNSSPDQPVSVHFEGDDGKPYKPCKSMRRVMIYAWGTDGRDYIGRRMTLFREESVKFGGIEVGGIRISHMSHIDDEIRIALTVTRAQRKGYIVSPLGPDPEDSLRGAKTVLELATAWSKLSKREQATYAELKNKLKAELDAKANGGGE